MISGVSYASYYYEKNTKPIYHVIVNGKEIGIVNNPEVIHKWAEKRLEEEQRKTGITGLKISDYITFKEEVVFKGEYDNEAAIGALAKLADIKVEAVRVLVNGKLVGYAANEQDVQTALNKVKEKFSGVPFTKRDAAVAAESDRLVKDVKFKEDIKTESGEVFVGQILPADKLVELLSKGTFKQMIHTVQEGDCITCIAARYGITSKDIYANNPGLTEDTLLQLGQKINVTAIRPFVTVQVVEEVENEEVIDYTTQTRENKQLPKGETRVVQSGKEGKKRVRYQLVKENGQVVGRKVLNQVILQNPVPKIIERGTKVIPSRGTGRFIWPARGYISSGFGMRWGRMHKGIDIAGSGSIWAADNGRVVQAGWNGNYGYSVTIDHGNGIRTLYGHLRSISVSVGQTVEKGQKIGVMGSTGDSTGVHLHFEVIQNGVTKNPIRYLR